MMGLWAREAGVEVAAAWNRSAGSAAATRELLGVECVSGALPGALAGLARRPYVVWVTVVDDALPEVAGAIAGWVPDGSVVLHTAGSESSAVLREAGVPEASRVGSLHPLLAVSDPRTGLERAASCTWTVEGDAEAVEVAREVASWRGVAPLDVDPQGKALYHAAAVTSANLLVALLDAADEMARRAGIARAEDRRAMLLPLARSCLANLETQSARDALTGPVKRGDWSTVERHREAMEGAPELRELYDVLTARAAQVAAREE
jgi:predicted short-subunit dehydrogenase-like oxidoreductase (DUF2520 family)